VPKKRYPQPHTAETARQPPPELEQILCDLASPEDSVRAQAVRQLCPCRGADWGVPIFPQVLALKDDPSPIVRHAVEHDLEENPWWNERQEAQRLEGRRARREHQQVRAEIDAGLDAEGVPGPHSQAWRMRPRPLSRKGHYPRQR
jgi:hypothetical protein